MKLKTISKHIINGGYMSEKLERERIYGWGLSARDAVEEVIG